jgi:hypothetical protein
LVDYELERISDNLDKAAILWTGIPVDYVARLNRPVTDMRDVSPTKDIQTVASGYFDLTTGCKSCRGAGNARLIRIQTPTSSLFGDEIYGL